MPSPLTVDGIEVPEPDLDTIWRRWEPRFASAGVDFNLLLKLKATITRWDEWCRVWSEAGDDLAAFASEAEERGDDVTAGESWFRAALLYQFGGMFYVWDLEQLREAQARKVEAFRRAAPHLRPPARRIEVDLDGVAMPAIVRNPLGDRPAPVVLIYNGFEGTKEECEARSRELHARGMATVSFDGPGRGEIWEQVPMTGNYGPATSALIDALEAIDDLDTTRIGATGPNRGGFLALKSAAVEPRLTAVAAASPGYDRRGTDFDDPYQVAFDLSLFHLETVAQLQERLQGPDLTLDGDVPNITCAVGLVAGGRDEGRQFSGSRQLFEELTGPKEWTVVPDAQRNGNNVPYKVRPILADFLARHLRAEPPA